MRIENSMLEKSRLDLFLTLYSPHADVKREYLTYDYNAFIADVGGYLGLLLGHSILSFYDGLTSVFDRIRDKFCIIV